jgi:hypothetical protein
MLVNKMEGTLIIDVDDVIVYTTPCWFKRIMDNFEDFDYYLNDDMIPNFPENYNYYNKENFMYPYTRTTYMFNDWLLRKNLSKEDFEEGSKMLMDLHCNNDFYLDFDLKFTQLADALKTLVRFSAYKFTKIVFVTRVPDATNKNLKEQKIKMLKDYFSDILKNIEIIIVDKFEKKSDVVKEYKNISAIYDDELFNIYDYIDNLNNIEGCTFMIPFTNYNMNFSTDYLKKAHDKNAIVKYYKYND